MHEDPIFYRARGGNKEAMEELLQRFRPLVLATAQRVRWDNAEWNELVQVGQIAVLEAIFDFRAGGRASFAWYARRRVNEALHDWRRRTFRYNGRHCSLGDDPGPLLAAAGINPSQDLLEQAEEAALVHRAMARLPFKQRLVLKWIYFQDRSQKDIALHLGVYESAINGLKNRGLANLRRYLPSLLEDRTYPQG